MQRLALLAVLLVVEWFPISSVVSTGRGGQSIARAIVAFTTLFLTFGYLRARHTIARISSQVEGVRISWGFLALHLGAMLIFLALSSLGHANRFSGAGGALLTVSWFAAGAAGTVLAGFAFAPARLWRDLFRTTGNMWIYALVVAGAVWTLVPVLWSVIDRSHWMSSSDITFRLVRLLLRPFLSDIVSDPSSLVLGSQRFAVRVGAACSGWEGVGLAFLFGILWLWIFRRECRFPQALLVIPAGMATMFALNTVRIAVLILIGNAGAPGVAQGGFHSAAGWIAFNAVALGFSLAAPRASWLMVKGPQVPHDTIAPNPTVPYLVPFAVILAAGMVSRAASAGFEWLYPLRFFAAAAAIWICRRKYLELDWKPGWLSPLAGIAVFIVWLALDRSAHLDNGIATGIAALSPEARVTWIVFRSMAAVVTVPLAEELAFRGFLLRRLISADFESVDLRRFTYVAVLGSSVAFGLMHGGQWLAGTLAGVLYATVMLRRGSIGSAVVAHATTNALIALTVLIGGKWYFW